MNKWLLRLIFILVVALIAYVPALLQKKQTGTAATPMPSFESVVPAPIKDGGPHVVYKWQENGVWHYADKPPANHSWETLTVRPETNLMITPGKHDAAPGPQAARSIHFPAADGRLAQQHTRTSAAGIGRSVTEFD